MKPRTMARPRSRWLPPSAAPPPWRHAAREDLAVAATENNLTDKHSVLGFVRGGQLIPSSDRVRAPLTVKMNVCVPLLPLPSRTAIRTVTPRRALWRRRRSERSVARVRALIRNVNRPVLPASSFVESRLRLMAFVTP